MHSGSLSIVITVRERERERVIEIDNCTGKRTSAKTRVSSYLLGALLMQLTLLLFRVSYNAQTKPSGALQDLTVFYQHEPVKKFTPQYDLKD